jgi:hypothetical protein
MKLKVKELFDKPGDVLDDFDIYQDCLDIDGVAFCPPLRLTDEGKAHYRKYLDLEVDFDDEKQNAWVLVDHLKNGEKLAEGVMEMFWDAAGFCSEKDYDKWFCDSEEV